MAFSLLTELSGLRKEIAMNAVTNKSISDEKESRNYQMFLRLLEISDLLTIMTIRVPSVFARQILAEEFKTFYL